MIKPFFNYLIAHKVQLLQYALVGLTTGGIYFLSFYFFYGLVGLDYRIGVSLSYLLAVCSHFLLHRSFTFKAGGQVFGNNLWKYLSMLLFNYVNMLAIVWIDVHGMKASPYWGALASTALATLINFFVMKYFVFRLKAT